MQEVEQTREEGSMAKWGTPDWNKIQKASIQTVEAGVGCPGETCPGMLMQS